MLIVLSLALGVMLWSFAEYALHNWYGHVAKGRNHFSRQHLKHHAEKDYFAPNSQKAMAALGVAAAIGPLAVMSAGWVLGSLFTLSFVSTYLYYEWVHWASHKLAPTTVYGRWVRKNHFSHHFNSPKHNHGVTSGIWDVVFRTSNPPDKVRVPAKFAMDWLVDENGEVKPEYAADYVVTRARRRQAA